jgi:hypothetical protein
MSLKNMAGTTRLELATSAVTVSELSALSTTWKSTDGTRSHWKYVVDNVIVYRDVYREGFCKPCRRVIVAVGTIMAGKITSEEKIVRLTTRPCSRLTL